jgi:hypothetical protein
MIKPIKFLYRDKTSKQIWLFKCYCGNEFINKMNSIKTGNTKSCGCWEKVPEHNPAYKHGHSRRDLDSREYICWLNIKARCYNPKGTGYKNYGARGIKVCQRWLDSFENFLNDLGRCPKGYEIERRNVDGDYSPENCCWIPEAEQHKNQRRYLRRGLRL